MGKGEEGEAAEGDRWILQIVGAHTEFLNAQSAIDAGTSCRVRLLFCYDDIDYLLGKY